MAPVIEARNVTHEYPDTTRAINDVSLTVDAGEQIAVVGPNGSGKSTLQLILGGLVGPTMGTVKYFNRTTDAEAIRERLGVLLQDPNDYLFNTTVREDIEYGPAQLEIAPEVATARIESLVTKLDLGELLDRPPFQLSGGEKQRVAIASVLSFNPDILLLDEPLSAVDAHYRNQILDLLNNHNGTTLVFTPSLDLVPLVAERVLLLGTEGTIVADDDVRTVLTNRSLLATHGLRPPAVVRLFEDIVDTNELPLTVSEARAMLLSNDV